MIHLRARTEYSFRSVFGQIDKVLAATSGPIGICDRFGTWGHCQWQIKCKAADRKPIFGVELAVVENMNLREKQGINWMAFLARNQEGLQELYELVSLSSKPEHYYYHPRIDYSTLFDISDNIFILSGAHPVWGSLPRRSNIFVELSPSSTKRSADFAVQHGFKTVATADNFYPTPADKDIYTALAGRDAQMRVTPMHLLSTAEWEMIWPNCQEALDNAAWIAEECNAHTPKATMVHFENMPSLRSLCEAAAPARGIDLSNQVYADRLTRELDLIHEKDFEDYFYLVWDLIRYAKTQMLVGPARGSSCGSLVCYLLSITEIDPIPYSLLFERFIDVNRKDLPDIDCDFPDDRREMVFAYLRQKYGADCVARLGTIMKFKAKSAIDIIAKELHVPLWELTNLKNSIIERSGGDSRASFCILDTFEQLEVGRKLLEKYPQMRAAADIEDHASGSGQHAAGIVVLADPVSHFCSVDNMKGSIQVDKHDAEELNLLKIDALGLRTLAVLQDCLDQVGWSREQLIAYPTSDTGAYALLNGKKFAGIFQFEGHALQQLCGQMLVESFEDIAALTALARPGPLHSGGTTEYIRRRTGEKPSIPLHPSIEHITKVTNGVVIYQENVMQIGREMGGLSWEDVSELRKAMSKSLGKEYFDKFWAKFRVGALKQGISEDDALTVWNNINTMGSWCVSGETLIQNPFPNHATPHFISIKKLIENKGYIRKHAEYKDPIGPYRGAGRIRIEKRKECRHDIIKKQQIYCLDQNSGTIKPERLVDCWSSGIQETFELCVESGQKIRATKQHRFLTKTGWIELKDLSIEMDIALMGGAIKGTKNKPFKGTGSGHHNVQHGQSLKFLESIKILHGIYTTCQNCHNTPYEETHHKDFDRLHNEIDNLLPVCKKCHKKIHREQQEIIPIPHQKGKHPIFSKIISIDNPMMEEVFDIQMLAPNSNFVANDFILHNCFNRSHAVAYAMVSYWCMVLKSKYPLEFAAACLRNARDDQQCIHLLREISKEGFTFKVYDPILSQKAWSVQDGRLIGGLLNIKGIGEKMADDIIMRRSRGIELTAGQRNKLANGETPYDHIFECEERWGHLRLNPQAYSIRSQLSVIEDMLADEEVHEYCFIAKLMSKDLRDLNDPTHVKKRNGNVIKGQALTVIFTVADDTDEIACSIDRHLYLRIGVPIIEQGNLGDWYIWKGIMKPGFRQVQVQAWRKLSGLGANPIYSKPE